MVLRTMSRSGIFRLQISKKMVTERQTLMLPSNMKSHLDYRLAYLHFTFAHSKD